LQNHEEICVGKYIYIFYKTPTVLILCIAAFFLWNNQCLLAENDDRMQARADISSTVNVKPLKNCTNPGWIKGEDHSRSLSASSAVLSSEEWIDFTFEFTPEADGEITLVLIGADIRDDNDKSKRVEKWCYFDEVSADGATILNGGFEELDDNSMLREWTGLRFPISDPEKAASGDNFIAVWHNRGAIQKNIQVKADQKITITAKVRKPIK